MRNRFRQDKSELLGATPSRGPQESPGRVSCYPNPTPPAIRSLWRPDMKFRLLWITVTAIAVLGLAAVACDGSTKSPSVPGAEITRVKPSPTAELIGGSTTAVPTPTPTIVLTAVPVPVPAPAVVPAATPAPVLTDDVDGYMALAPATSSVRPTGEYLHLPVFRRRAGQRASKSGADATGKRTGQVQRLHRWER